VNWTVSFDLRALIHSCLVASILAYATGLLCARRLLTKLNLADKYEGVVEPTGEFYEVEPLDDGPRPFKCYLDVGLKRTTTGAKVFGALKGASDGGLYIPHSEKRFPGYDAGEKTLSAEVLRSYIFGGHVSEYMSYLEEDDEDRYKKQFSSYLKLGLNSESIEDMYTEAHSAIRANPAAEKKANTPEQIQAFTKASKKYRKSRLNYKQRKDKVKQKKAAFLKKIGASGAGSADVEDAEE
jgi:large subunit ribosomal protein L5e